MPGDEEGPNHRVQELDCHQDAAMHRCLLSPELPQPLNIMDPRQIHLQR